MVSAHPPSSWFRSLRERYAAHVWLKALLTPLGMAGFFVCYFYLLRHPGSSVTPVPLTPLDPYLDFHPWAIVPYFSLWLYVVVGAGTLRTTREIRVYCSGVILLAAVGLGLFFLWPTTLPAFATDWSRYPSLRFLKSVDAAGNACPSLHVAYAVFTAIWLERIFRQDGVPAGIRLGNAAWAAAIAYSTLATKQHAVADVLAGATLGTAFGLLDPRPPGGELSAAAFWPDRRWLAFSLSLLAKLTVLVLGFRNSHPVIGGVVFFAPDAWILTALLVPNFSGLLPTATRFATTRRELWLTIDDGPEPATTRPMLDLLDRHEAKATFFVIGEKAAARPELLDEIRRRGHTLGNHTLTHPLATFWLAGPRRTAREVEGAAAALRGAGMSAPVWFRAPAGIKTFFLRDVLAQRDQVLVGWSVRGRENVSTSPAAPLRRLKRGLRPGAIVLLHESATHSADRLALLSAFLDHASAAGYRCVLPERAALA